MQLKTKLILIFLFCSFYSIKIHAQNFNYSLQKDSSAYSALTGAQIISSGENFRSKSFTIHLPFQFNFCGSITDSLIIEGNGLVVFNAVKGIAILSFNNFTSQKDTNQVYSSSIDYTSEGNSGNRILKIEFNNLAQNQISISDNLSYQIWLYENGNKIEFHIGSNPFTNGETAVLIGLINRNMDTDNKAYWISGDSSSPTGQSMSGDADLSYMTNIPSNGTIYKLTPSF